MKYITLLAGFGLIGTIIYFGLQSTPIEKQPVTEVIEQVITEPTSPKIEPKATVTPKKAKVPTKVEKVAPKLEIATIQPSTAPIQEQPKPVEEVKVVEVPKVEVKTDYITAWNLEGSRQELPYRNGTPKQQYKVKGNVTWSNGVGVTYLTGCDIITKTYTDDNVLLNKETMTMQQQDPNNFALEVIGSLPDNTKVFTKCKTFQLQEDNSTKILYSDEVLIK